MNQPVFDRDSVLEDLADARKERDESDRIIRQLVAYGREFVRPRPYTLAALAAAAGMSPSGVSTCYGESEIVAVAALLRRHPSQLPQGGK